MAPRVVEVPDDLAGAIAADGRAKASFDALSVSRRRESVSGFSEAKREATRERRIGEAVEMSREGKAR